MNLFQNLAMLCLICLTGLTVAAAATGKATRREALVWCLLWVSAGIAILKPDLTMALARRLGIGRGADLLLYCTVGVTMLGFIMVYIRLRRLRREITMIVRHIAIKEAHSGVIPPQSKS